MMQGAVLEYLASVSMVFLSLVQLLPIPFDVCVSVRKPDGKHLGSRSRHRRLLVCRG